MILGSTLDIGVGPFLFFHTVNLVVQSLPLEYYTTKINSLPVILELPVIVLLNVVHFLYGQNWIDESTNT